MFVKQVNSHKVKEWTCVGIKIFVQFSPSSG